MDRYKCDICDYIGHQLNRHKRLKHSKLKTPIKQEMTVNKSETDCEICDKTFKTTKGLNMHTSRLHSISLKSMKQEDSIIRCEICDKTIFIKYDLEHHALVHSGTTYKCKLCDKQYKWQNTLKNHMLSHSQSKNCKDKIDQS